MLPSTVGRLVDRFRSSPPLPASSRAPVDPSALWWKSGRADAPSASLSDHSRATDAAVETALFAVASAAPDSGDVISRALAVIQESRRAYETGLLRGLQSCAPMRGASSASSSSSGLKSTGAPFTPSALNASASAPAESDAFDALDALNDVPSAESAARPTPPAAASSQPAARAPTAERLSVLSFGSSPDASSAPRRTSALPLGFAARIPSLRPQPELAAAEAAAAAESFRARARAPTPPLEREARSERTDSLTVAIAAGIDSAMQTLGVPRSSAEGIDSAMQTLRLPAGYNDDVGAASARAFDDHSLYADPAIIALEDPELTIARLRRRLATVDDAFAPRLAPYTPAFAAGAAAHAAAEHAATAAAADASLTAERSERASASALLTFARDVGENPALLRPPPPQPLFLSPDSTFFGTESVNVSSNAESSASDLGAAAAPAESTASLSSSSASTSSDDASNDDTSDDDTSVASDVDTSATTTLNQTGASISSTAAAAATVKTADLLSRLRDAMYCSETVLLT
jgi:hypothetical protein